MKKVLLLIPCLLLVVAATAQELRIGLRGGLNLANQSIESEELDAVNFDYDSEGRIAWQAGLVIDAAITDMFAIQPALLLSSKGHRFEENNALFDLDTRARLLYVHVPVPVLVRVGVGDLAVFGGLGPYFSFGVGGSLDSEGDAGGIGFNEEGDIDWGGDVDDDDFRRLDAGLVLTGGVEVLDIQLALSYELGLTNIQPEGDSDNSVRNRVLSLTGTIFF